MGKDKSTNSQKDIVGQFMRMQKNAQKAQPQSRIPPQKEDYAVSGVGVQSQPTDVIGTEDFARMLKIPLVANNSSGMNSAGHIPPGNAGQQGGSLLSSLRSTPNAAMMNSGMGGVRTENPTCSECGLVHPPLKPGERCLVGEEIRNKKQNAIANRPQIVNTQPVQNIQRYIPEETQVDDDGIDYNILLKPMKNMIKNYIHSRNIKNVERFFSEIIIEISNIIENKYEEKIPEKK